MKVRQINLKKTAIIFLQILIFYCVGFSQTAEEFFKKGKEHQSKREYELAATAFGEAIKLKTDYPEAFFERGRTNQMALGERSALPFGIYNPKLKSVFDDFQQAIYLSPNVANYYYHRGLNYYASSKFSEAIEDFTKAIALAPDQAEGYRMRFEAYFQQDDYDKALSDINKAIELQPNALPLFFGRGILNLERDNCSLFEKAIDDFSFIISRNPNFPVVYKKRAEAYKKLARCSREIAEDYDRKAHNEEQKGENVAGFFLNSRVKSLTQPIYPKNVTGLNETVTVKVTVNGNGNVIKAEMMYGDSRFKTAAETAALTSKFSPTIIDGKPLETWGWLKLNFIAPTSSGGGYGMGNGTGEGFSGNSKPYFITEKLEIRRYLPGDTEPLGAYKTFIFGELDLPTTNSANLFVVEKPSVEPDDTPLQIISKPAPSRTEAARKNNIQGTVRLRVTFLANGTIGSVSTVSGLPYGLTEQAISAAKQIRFFPATKKGVPITVTRTVEYSFKVI